MSTQPHNKDEEVDLGSLFIIIGNGFKRFFNFLGSVFLGIFHFIILILLFLKDNLIKLAIAALIGGGIGAYFEFTKEKTFGSDLLLQPNFESTKQSYDNVNYYNELVGQEEVSSLMETFDISEEEAMSLRRFEVKPIKSENDILESYGDLVLSVDTLTVQSYSYEMFKKAFTEYDYKTHEIHVEATDSKVFKKLDGVIIGSLIENKYFNTIKNLTREDLYRRDSILKENLGQLDSLRRVYMDVMIEEAKKESTGTNIDLGGDVRTTKELELFKVNRTIIYELRRVSSDIAEMSEIVNVVSNFQPVGYEITGITNNKIIVYGVLGLVLVISILLLIKLNTYLEGYKKK